MMIRLNLSINELTEKIKLQGEIIETEETVFAIPNNKYVDRRIIYYDEVFWVVYSILDDYEEKCYWEDMEEYNSEQSALTRYHELLETLQS